MITITPTSTAFKALNKPTIFARGTNSSNDLTLSPSDSVRFSAKKPDKSRQKQQPKAQTPPPEFVFRVPLTPELESLGKTLKEDSRYGNGAVISIAQIASDYDVPLPLARDLIASWCERGLITPLTVTHNYYRTPWLINDANISFNPTVTRIVDDITAMSNTAKMNPFKLINGINVVNTVSLNQLPMDQIALPSYFGTHFTNHPFLTKKFKKDEILRHFEQQSTTQKEVENPAIALWQDFATASSEPTNDPLAGLSLPRDIYASSQPALTSTTPNTLTPQKAQECADTKKHRNAYLHRILSAATPGEIAVSEAIFDLNPHLSLLQPPRFFSKNFATAEQVRTTARNMMDAFFNPELTLSQKSKKFEKSLQIKLTLSDMQKNKLHEALRLSADIYITLAQLGFIDRHYRFTHKVDDYKRTDSLVGRFNQTADKKLTFYLVPPPKNQGTWTLGYCWTLPKLADESESPRLGIPSKIYSLPSTSFDTAAFTSATERALDEASLSFAALRNQYFPGIPPKPLEMNTDEVIQFLTSAAPRLKRAGFEVLLPKRLAEPQAQAGPTDPELTGSSHGSLSGLVDTSDIQTDETLREILGTRTQWVETDNAAFRKARDILKLQNTSGNTGAAGLSTNAMDEDLIATLEGLLTRIQSGPAFSLQTPPTNFNANLLNFQQVGYSWLKYNADRGVGSILADTMGLGKTIQTLALIQDRYNQPVGEGKKRKPTLIVAPPEVIPGWIQEIAGRPGDVDRGLRHIPAKTTIPASEILDLPSYIRRNPRATDADIRRAIESATVVLTTYQTMRSRADVLAGDEDSPVEYDGVILDEAHHIADPEALQSEAAFRLGNQANYRVALTGTPIQNRLLDIASLVNFAEPGRFGSFRRFVQDYEAPIEKGTGSSQQVINKLVQKLAPIMLRRSAHLPQIAAELDGFMPARNEHVFDLPLDTRQQEYYLAVLAGDNVDRTVLETLRKICNHPAMALPNVPLVPGAARAALTSISEDNDPTPRMAHLNNLINTQVLPKGEQIVIFTHFVEMAERLGAYLSKPEADGQPKKPALVITGKTEAKERQRYFNAFKNDGKNNPILIMTYGTGGEGLNLQNARHVALFDPEWNPFKEEQAISRIQRIMDRSVYNINADTPLPAVEVYRYTSHMKLPENPQPFATVEGRMQQVKLAKSRLASAVVGHQGSDNVLAGMSQMDLLRREIEELRTRPTPQTSA